MYHSPDDRLIPMHYGLMKFSEPKRSDDPALLLGLTYYTAL